MVRYGVSLDGYIPIIFELPINFPMNYYEYNSNDISFFITDTIMWDDISDDEISLYMLASICEIRQFVN